jgi:hypothetical protein
VLIYERTTNDHLSAQTSAAATSGKSAASFDKRCGLVRALRFRSDGMKIFLTET